ncbi:hypothetical protein [Plantactinospora sp. GCM10030261]|uniref:hypothetical protein n=1 Tax=Plantactinospora sp. GCM10030261 TaxID=3273420 RepID=UPI00362394B6
MRSPSCVTERGFAIEPPTDREWLSVRAGDLLRQLDGQVLPRLSRVLAEVGQGPLRLRVLSWTAVLSVAAVLATAVWAVDRRPAGDPTVGEVARVGVAQGDSIPRYVESAEGQLAALAGPGEPAIETYALVTLDRYVPPDRLAPTLAGAPVAEVFGRVPLAGVQTQIVRIPVLRLPDDALAGMAEMAGRKDREARDYAERGAAVRGAGREQQELRIFYEASARVAAAEATGYRAGCSCLYAAVVRATPRALRRVADRPGVRAVDPAPEVTRLDRAVFTPPLPEQTDVARPPLDSAMPGSSAADPAAPPPIGTPDDTSTPPLPPAPSYPTGPGGTVSPPTGDPSSTPPAGGSSPPPAGGSLSPPAGGSSSPTERGSSSPVEETASEAVPPSASTGLTWADTTPTGSAT